MSKPNDYEGEKFLLKLYDKNLYDKNLYDKKSVNHSSLKSDNKFEAVRKYLNRLDGSKKVFERDKKSAEKYLKKCYFDKYVIKPEEISSEYLDKKKRICCERGRKFSKNTEISKILKCQTKSLEKWIDYLMSDKIDYPMWVRYWAFQGMLRLGHYDYEKHAFGTRTRKTISPFAKRDVEALEQTMKSVRSYYSDGEITDSELDTLIEQGNFGKIYARFLWISENNIKERDVKSNDGIWVKYSQGSDWKKMHKSIAGKFTFWCIEEESVAEDYMSVGDVYIYFTKDINGDFSVPRLAVVTEFDEVVEARGIADAGQNIEGSLLDILYDKINEFSHNKRFDLMYNDMKYLYEILDKESTGKMLSRDDLKFIYEFDKGINYFGRSIDSEVMKFRGRRDIKKDYSIIFDCSSDLVGTGDDFINKELYLYIGDIELNFEKLPKDFKCPSIVLGNFEAPYLDSALGLENLSVVYGSLVINNMIDPLQFENLNGVYGDLYANNLETPIPNLEYIGGKSFLNNVEKRR